MTPSITAEPNCRIGSGAGASTRQVPSPGAQLTIDPIGTDSPSAPPAEPPVEPPKTQSLPPAAAALHSIRVSGMSGQACPQHVTIRGE